MKLATTLYRALVACLPRRMRIEYGDAIIAQFEEDLARARGTGPGAAGLVVAGAAWDLLRCLPREHWRVAGQPPHEEVMTNFLADIRFALRSFRRQRGATALVLLTLVLAVAANTGVFVLLDGLFLRPVPFADPSRLVYLNERAPKWNLDFTGINFPDFVSWREHTHAFEAIGLFDQSSFNLSSQGVAERVAGAQITWDLPAAFGVRPVLGRFFRPEEDRPNGPHVVILGYDFWRTRFGATPNAIGQTLRIEGLPFTVIGVAPSVAEFPGKVQLWIPLQGDPQQNYQNYSSEGIGKLKPGVTLEQANADLRAAHEPIWRKSDTAHVVSPRIMPLRDWVIGESRTTGQVLGLGALLVLLIACANVAGAMLARSTMRRRELAIRVALGANGGRLARLLLTEALLLATIAGVIGTALGWWAVRAVMFAAPDQLPGWIHLTFNPRVALFGGALIALVTLLFGLGPALAARREGVRDAISTDDQRAGTSGRQRRVLNGLVVVEIALAAVLLIAGGLLVRGFANLQHVDPGFRTEGAVQFRISLPDATYQGGPAQRRFYERAIERLRAIPGVTAVGAITCLPFTCHWGNFYNAEGSALRKEDPNPVVLSRIASPDYFQAFGIRFVRGHAWTASEQRPFGQLFPLVINEEFAKLHWPNIANPIGRRVQFNGADSTSWMTVVGVVHDVRHYGLTTPMRPGIYMPMSLLDSPRQSWGNFGFVVKGRDNPLALESSVRAAMHELDPELPVYQLRTVQNALDASLAARRSLMLVLSAFAGIALMLAVGGIYAVLSYVVGRRRREIGIRMALGARREQVLGMVVRQGLLLIGIGLVIGLPVALAGSGLLSSLLVGVEATDAATWMIAIAVLTITGTIAAFAPARRAASVDPRVVLSES